MSVKSHSCLWQFFKWNLEESNVVSMWVAPHDAKAIKCYKALVKHIRESGHVKSYRSQAGQVAIVRKNESVLKFRSVASRNSLRGESITYMVCDEVSFIPKDIFEAVLIPMWNVNGRRCLLVTIPKEKSISTTYS